MIRVLQEVATMDVGGVERLLYDYYSNLDKGNIAFDFVIFDREKEGIFENPLKEMGCRFHYVPRVKGLGIRHTLALWKILKGMGILDHPTCLLRNLYAGKKQQFEPDMEQ